MTTTKGRFPRPATQLSRFRFFLRVFLCFFFLSFVVFSLDFCFCGFLSRKGLVYQKKIPKRIKNRKSGPEGGDNGGGWRKVQFCFLFMCMLFVVDGVTPLAAVAWTPLAAFFFLHHCATATHFTIPHVALAVCGRSRAESIWLFSRILRV